MDLVQVCGARRVRLGGAAGCVTSSRKPSRSASIAASTRFRSDLPTLFRSKRNLENDVSMRNVASSNAEERQFCRDNRTAAGGRGSEGLDAKILENTIFVKVRYTIFFINRTIRHEMSLRATTMQPMSFIFRSSLRIDGSFRQSTWRPPSARRLSKFY